MTLRLLSKWSIRGQISDFLFHGFLLHYCKSQKQTLTEFKTIQKPIGGALVHIQRDGEHHDMIY